MISEFDAWLARHVFHPLAYGLCWLFDMGQYRLSRMLSVVTSICYAVAAWQDFLWLVPITLIFLAIDFAIYYYLGDLPPLHQNSPAYRVIGLILTLIFVIPATVAWNINLLWFAGISIAVIAAYANTITTLPPPPTFKRRPKEA